MEIEPENRVESVIPGLLRIKRRLEVLLSPTVQGSSKRGTRQKGGHIGREKQVGAMATHDELAHWHNSV